MKYVTRLPLILILVSLSGCASVGNLPMFPKFGDREKTLTDRNSETVATDFVSALSSLRGHLPTNTMLQIRPTKTKFGNSLKRELRNAGYGIQSIPSNDTGPMLVTYEADSFENTNYESVAYRVRVGSVELGREYEIRAGNIFPVTSLSVKGVEISSKPLDQTMFERATARDESESGKWLPVTPGFQQQPKPAVIVTPIPQREWIVKSDPQERTEMMDKRAENQSPALVAQSKRPKEVVNMLMLGESNYAEIYEDYKVVKTKLLVFPNDSLRMGQGGKNTVSDFLSGYNENSDILSVVGCSHGKTGIKNGNEKLALGRAQRVIDELLGHRILASNIYDEGCWAGVEQKQLPARGVILTLRRAKISLEKT